MRDVRPDPRPASLGGHAADDLRFIRMAMAGSSTFTAVPGWSGVWMGLSAVTTAFVAGPAVDSPAWLRWWLADACIGFALGVLGISRKMRRAEAPLSGAVTRRFVLACAPALVVGAALTPVLVGVDGSRWLPGLWLLTYGAGVLSAGAYSIRLVPILGALLMLCGGAALLVPAAAAHWLMAVGFGGLQVGFGWVIARRHGG